MQACYSSSAKPVDSAKTIPSNLLEDKQTAVLQKENGTIFDKRPFKIHLDKGIIEKSHRIGAQRTSIYITTTRDSNR